MISQPSRADRAVAYMQTLEQSRGPRATETLELRDWQEAWIRGLFNGQTRRSGLWIPRKNGKSAMAAAIACFVFAEERPPSGEIILAAPTIKQAGRLYETCQFMLAARYPGQFPKMKQRGYHGLRFSANRGTKEIVDQESNTKLFVLSADGAGHGYGPALVICDELHEWRRQSELWPALQTSFGDQEQGLLVTITTVGTHDPEHMEHREFDYAKSVLDGSLDDPTYLPVIYAAGKDDQWDDPETWHKCNPALGDFLSYDNMRTLCEKAKKQPSLENDFRRLFLNQRTAQVTRWLSVDEWKACERSEVDVNGGFAGLDLSTKLDVTSLVIVAPTKEGYACEPYFWIPEETADTRFETDRIPYRRWMEEGHLEFTPGNRVDQKYIVRRVLEICEERRVSHVGIDPWNAEAVMQALTEEGLEVVEVRQSPRHMSEPCRELEALLADKTFEHPGNPVLNWMAGNVELYSSPAGHCKPVKPKGALKVDGITALVMALGECIHEKAKPSFDYYAERDLEAI